PRHVGERAEQAVEVDAVGRHNAVAQQVEPQVRVTHRGGWLVAVDVYEHHRGGDGAQRVIARGRGEFGWRAVSLAWLTEPGGGEPGVEHRAVRRGGRESVSVGNACHGEQTTGRIPAGASPLARLGT